MQLSDLLARLLNKEREIVYERRGVPEQARVSSQAIATSLTDPTSLVMAVSELNATQMRLLEWLGEQRGLQATWQELIRALGDSITPDVRDAYLKDLRLLALVDAHPKDRGGFVATYPAVVSALPFARRQTLLERFGAINSDILLKICSALAIRPTPSRKDQRIEAILRIVTDPAACRRLVETLSDSAQKLFSWLLEHRGTALISEVQKRVARPPAGRHGYPAWTMEAIWTTPEQGQLDPLSELMRFALVYPISPNAWYPPTGFVVPGEILRAFTGQGYFDSTRRPPPLDQAEVTSPTIPNPSHVLRDVGHLLGFVGAGRCEWRQDGQPYKRSLVAFGKLIENKDLAYTELLWDLFVRTGLVTKLPSGPPDYVTEYEPAATDDFSPEQLMVVLVGGWLAGGELTLGRGGLLYLRDNPRMRLLIFLRTLPPNIWVLKSAVMAWLRFSWPLVFAPDLLGMGAEPPDPAWSGLTRLLLGHGTTADGQEAIMLTEATHQFLNQPEEGPVSGSILLPWDDHWIAQPDRTIMAPPNLLPNALADLWRVADLESNQGAAVFRVSVASVAAALNRGMTPDEIRSVLTTRSRTPLPPTVERLIDDQSARYGRIKVGSAQTFVQTDDPALLSELRRHAKLKNLGWHDVAPGVAFVQGDGPDAVLEALRKAGYLPVRAETEKTPARGPAGGVRAGIVSAKPVSAKAIQRIVNKAIRDDDDLKLTWTERGRTHTESVTPIDLHQDTVHVSRGDDGAESEISFGAITAIEIEQYDYDDEDDDLDFLIDAFPFKER